MSFTESLKHKIKKKGNWQCCICEAFYVEIHHIIPQEEGGPDSEDNAAPLCPNCHDTYGSNPQKRKFIREKRDDWFEKCEKKYNLNPLLESINKKLEKVITIDELKGFEDKLIKKIEVHQMVKPNHTSLPFSQDFRIYINQNSFSDAINLLKNNIAEFFYLLGYCYGEQKKITDMIKSFDESISINDNYKSEIENSKKYYLGIIFNSGVEFYKEAGKQEAEKQKNDLLEKSITAFNDTLLIDPEYSDTYKNLALAYINLKNYDKAIPILETFLQKQTSLDGYKFLGELLYDKGNKLMTNYKENKEPQDKINAIEYFNKAITVLEKGRKEYPNDPNILLTLSNSYIGANQVEVAMNVFKAGIEMNPNNKYYRYNLGVLYLGAKEYKNAEEQFKKAIEIDTNYENANYNLAVTYVRWATEMRDSLEVKDNTSQDFK